MMDDKSNFLLDLARFAVFDGVEDHIVYLTMFISCMGAQEQILTYTYQYK